MTKQTKELFQMTLEHSILMAWEIDGETVETVSDFILRGSKITMKLKDAYSLEGKL